MALILAVVRCGGGKRARGERWRIMVAVRVRVGTRLKVTVMPRARVRTGAADDGKDKGGGGGDKVDKVDLRRVSGAEIRAIPDCNKCKFCFAS